MIPYLPVARLVDDRLRVMGLRKSELVKRLGYMNTGKGLRRLDAFCQGNFTDTEHIARGLPHGLLLAGGELEQAIAATKDILRDGAQILAEANERALDEAFRLHAYWKVNWNSKAHYLGMEECLRVEFPEDIPPQDFSKYVRARLIEFPEDWGPALGFVVNYSRHEAVVFDLDGNPTQRFPMAIHPSFFGEYGASSVSSQQGSDVGGGVSEEPE